MRLTKTQSRLMALLSDGLPHSRRELTACVDELCSYSNLSVHLFNLRKQLRPEGVGIIFHGRRGGYQVCRFVAERHNP
jgi:hypothetical protein